MRKPDQGLKAVAWETARRHWAVLCTFNMSVWLHEKPFSKSALRSGPSLNSLWEVDFETKKKLRGCSLITHSRCDILLCPRQVLDFYKGKGPVIPSNVTHTVLLTLHLPARAGKLCLVPQTSGQRQKWSHLSWKWNLCLLSSSPAHNYLHEKPKHKVNFKEVNIILHFWFWK